MLRGSGRRRCTVRWNLTSRVLARGNLVESRVRPVVLFPSGLRVLAVVLPAQVLPVFLSDFHRENAIEYEHEQSLERVEDAEQILEGKFSIFDGENAKQPG